jgi:CBS domain-containing protein
MTIATIHRQESPMFARDIMTRQVVTCTPQNTVLEAAVLLATNDCGILPVIDDQRGRKPIGVLTDRDIVCRVVAQGKDPAATRVSDCMSTPVACVQADVRVEECVRLLADNHIRRLVVVDDDGSCCGIIAQADVARFLPQETAGQLVREVSAAPESEQQRPPRSQAAEAQARAGTQAF